MKRVVTALLLIPGVLYIVFLAHPVLFLAAVALVALFCYHEYCGLAAAHGWGLGGPFGYAAGLLLLVTPRAEFALLALCALGALILALRHEDLSKVLPGSATLVLGLVYVFAPWRFAVELRHVNPHLLLYAMALCWVGDTAAFCAGSLFGRHKLAPRLSPAKSWEGAVASLLVSVLFGASYLTRFVPEFTTPAPAIALSVAANLAGQAGDLAESALKRGAGVKDSGALLPGHGGFLDRVDSTLFSVPVVYFWLAAGGMLASATI